VKVVNFVGSNAKGVGREENSWGLRDIYEPGRQPPLTFQ
jgi:hypothetical protein